MLSSIFTARLRLLPAAVAALVHCGTASAALSDTIHPFVALGYTYDDNLLRLPDDYPIEQRSDRARQAQAGFTIDRPFGRQRLTGSAKVSRVTFDHFDQLNYNGKDFRADLAWQLGNRFSGNAGGYYAETLTPFSDFNSSERNLRTTRQEYLNGAWRFHPSWQLRSGFMRTKFSYELQAQRVNDRTEDIAEFGGDFLAPSGSRIGLVARHLKGSYQNPRTVAGIALNDDYSQDELKANIDWRFSGITRITVLAGYAKRDHAFFSNRDSDGFNGRAAVNWAPLGKVRFTVEGWREFAAVESYVVSNSLNRGGSISATWDLSGKLQANSSYRAETRKFEQLPNIAFTGNDSDHSRTASLGLTWTPTMKTQLGISAFRERRTGSALASTNDYTSNGVSVNASMQF